MHAVAPAAMLAAKPHPVVLWHGLGDSAYSYWLINMKQRLERTYPGIFVYIVSLGSSYYKDQGATLFGDVNAQVAYMYETLQFVPELQDGFDAIGFSQGGQFLRAYVERYNVPRVRNLITFGSQHMGITELSVCHRYDYFCRYVHHLLDGQVYSNYSQTHLVPAQYFRDTRSVEQFALYNQANQFLHDINNEGTVKNETYAANLAGLETFAMVQFTHEETVVPSASSWFEAYNDPCKKECDAEIVPLRASAIYREDWIGLGALDRRGALAFLTCDGRHMEITPECAKATLGTYIGRPLLGAWDAAVDLNVHSNPVQRAVSPFLLALCALVLCMGIFVLRRKKPSLAAL
ncbi:palmitoyl-protein hydrolase [Malassezia vespertilionis]|uniref:Palmitoyl-protein thioesterase 1 n=1 Tax=Malassezia vespertilionis TaxID=2020962 RepID=A0A2N1JGQ7_9BASI|nr:palmitoyl-protein hydrolase [Malassezia vespertilionis]PKI85737.1 hypothetical protein MVES_000254 [Malassezia vespertilionis]WFD04943.1 palmitoyl-protein hydrolase [Malassezia vespertilionis]